MFEEVKWFSKYILNRKQKRATLVSCTLFAFVDYCPVRKIELLRRQCWYLQ